MIEGLTVCFLVLMFLFITKHWEGWYIMGTGIQILVILGMLWLPESPEFYFAKGRFDESKLVLLRIAKVNGRHIGADSICFDNVGKEKENGGSGSEFTDDSNDISEPFTRKKKSNEPVAKHC